MTDASASGGDAARPLIVVIDDDFDMLEWCRLVLESAGFHARCFFGTSEALEFMGERRPALIITDLMMADLNSGFDFARALKEDPRFSGVPVMMMTAAASRRGFDFAPQSREDLQAMSVDAFFAKPADPKRFVAAVRALAEGGGAA